MLVLLKPTREQSDKTTSTLTIADASLRPPAVSPKSISEKTCCTVEEQCQVIVPRLAPV
jgi:hypothetical protein